MMTGDERFDRHHQAIWGALGGLTPYAVAGLKAVGYRTDFPLPSFSFGFLLCIGLSVSLGVIGAILLESHARFAAWYHGGSFPIMLNFLFGEALLQAGTRALH
jgi:hypothetical protein